MHLRSGTGKDVTVRTAPLERVSVMEVSVMDVGAMRVGAMVPSGTALCWEFGVSRTTLRHAVDGLVQDGRLARQTPEESEIELNPPAFVRGA